MQSNGGKRQADGSNEEQQGDGEPAGPSTSCDELPDPEAHTAAVPSEQGNASFDEETAKEGGSPEGPQLVEVEAKEEGGFANSVFVK